MGVDGVVPGEAYTLLAKASSTDSTFAVFLVKLLQDGGQGDAVSADLLQMAQADAQWTRVMSGGGHGGGGRGGARKGHNSAGLGLGYWTGETGHQKAMTSSMLADMTASSARRAATLGTPNAVDIGVLKAYEKLSGPQSVNSSAAAPPPLDVAANPYIAGRCMGRGKHMTEPSWTPAFGNDVSVHTHKVMASQTGDVDAAMSADVSAGPYVDAAPDHVSRAEDKASEAAPTKKRKNRFAELFSDSPSEVQQQFTPPAIVASTPLPGFVRASKTDGLSSVTAPTAAHNSSSHASPHQGKKTRWQ